MIADEIANVTQTLARYNACLRKEYGVDINQIGIESQAAWEHLIGAAQHGMDPIMATRRLAVEMGLMPAGNPFASTVEQAGLYNRYRLALIAHAEEVGLPRHPTNGAPIENIEGRPMLWDVAVHRDANGRISHCQFKLHDPGDLTNHVAPDIDETRTKARHAVLQLLSHREPRAG